MRGHEWPCLFWAGFDDAISCSCESEVEESNG